MRALFLLYCLLFLAAGNLAGQQPFFKNYQIKDGLLSNYIYFVFQDSKGYIWVSSDVGVSRFDGQSFTNFNTGQGVPDNEVFSMYEDSKGRIWFATLNGKPGFYHNGVFYNEHNLELLQQKEVTGLVSRIFENSKGEIIYVYGLRMVVFNLEQNTTYTVTVKEPLLHVWELPNGNFGTVGQKLGEISAHGHTFKDITLPAPVAPFRAIIIGDTLVVTNSNLICFVDIRQNKIVYQAKPLDGGNEYIYLYYHDQKIWAGTRNGIAVFDYPSLQETQRYLKGCSVSSMARDREGGLWFSSLESGLYYVPAPDILHFTTSDGLLYNRIICLSRSTDGRLWIGSEGSTFSIFDGKIFKTRQILKETIKNKNVVNIRHFPDGTTLVVGKAGTLILKNGKEGFLYHRATDINIDSAGNYWGTLNGLYRIDKNDVPHKTFPASFLSKPGGQDLYKIRYEKRIVDVRAERLVFDDDNRLWMASPNGLFFLNAAEKLDCILPYNVKDLLFDEKTAVLWVLTESKGLFALKDGLPIDSIQIANSRGNVICWDLCKDENDDLWIGSAGGLFRVDGKAGNLRLINYWGLFGLGSEKINAVEVIGDHIFIGKDDGLLQVPKYILTRNNAAPPVLINRVQVRNGELPQPYSGEFQMEYGRQQLSIHFEGLSYREPQSIQYRYRLKGLNDNWYVTSNEAVEYAALRPGHYIFEVYAVNGAGVQSIIPAAIQFYVLTPFWQKSWFIVLILALLSIFVRAYIKNREKKLHRKYEVEHQLMEGRRINTELQKKNSDLQMLALRLQMNPHFIFNALNTIKGYYGQAKIVEANSFISKFARLLRLNLDYSDSAIPLDQEIELLKIYVQLSKIRFPDKILMQLDIAADINPLDMVIPSMLIQPFVENAVIHGVAPKKDQGNIFIHFSKNDDEIIVRITDDGVGRSNSGKKIMQDLHKPLATQITIDRLRLLRKTDNLPVVIRDLYDSTGNPAGTEVTLFIPFQINQPT